MNDFEKGRFQKILQNTYNNNLKELNDALEKHTQHIDNKKEANKNAYVKYREDDDFKQKKSQYDKQYYQDNKHRLLQSKKNKYHNDIEYQTKLKEKQKLRYLELNKLKNFFTKIS